MTLTGSTAQRRSLAAAVLAALALRLLFALVYWVDKPLTVDQVEYLWLADRLADGHGLTFPEGEQRLMRSPGYPLFLAAVRSLVPGERSIKVAQSIVGALSVLLVAAMARRMGGRLAAVAAAIGAAVYPPLVFEPAYVLSETLYTAVALGTAVLAWQGLDAADEAGRRGRFAAAGVAGGLTMLVRPEFALFLGFIGVLLLWQRHWVPVALLGVFAAVTVAPWPLYNVVVQDRVILLSSRGGPNLWMGNNALARGDGDVGANPAMQREYDAIIAANAHLPPQELERLFYRRSFEFISGQPLAWVALLLRKAFWFFVPFGPSYQARSPLFWFTHAASWLGLLGFSVAAWPRVRRLHPRPWVPAALAASVFATCMIFFPLERYRVPVLDPVLIACAATLAGSSRLDGEAGDSQSVPIEAPR